MRKIISLILLVCMLTGMTFPLTAFAADEAQITSHYDYEWVNPTENIVIKWTKASGNATYKITIIDNVTKEEFVRNKVVTGTSYTIKAGTLDYEQCYKIWVGTFDGEESRGYGSVIYLNTDDLISATGGKEAEISYPSNNAKIDATSKVTVKFKNVMSEFDYKITLLNNETGQAIFRNKSISGSSYTIAANTMKPNTEYKIWIGTYYDGRALGEGDAIFITTEAEAKVYEKSTIISPSDETWLDPAEKITFKFSGNDSDTVLKLKIVNNKNKAVIVDEEKVDGTKYVLNEDVLDYEEAYTVTLITYNGKTKIGEDSIVIRMNGMDDTVADYEPSIITSPKNESTVSNSENLKITWENDSELSWWISINDETTGEKIFDNKNHHTAYCVIDKNELIAGHNYRAWLGTKKRASVEGKLLGEDEVYFSVADTEEMDYEKATITAPKDGAEVDASEKITVKFNNVVSELEYKIAILQTKSGAVITDRFETVTGTSYTISADTLASGDEYSIELRTYNGDSLIGEDKVIITTSEEEVDYEKATITAPKDGAEVDASDKITLKFSNIISALSYKLTVTNEDDGDEVISNKSITGTYTIPADTLEAGSEYSIGLRTYNGGSLVGGDEIYITTKAEMKVEEATIISPEDGDYVDASDKLTLKFGKMTSGLEYKITLLNTDKNAYVFRNKDISNASYTISANTLESGATYKLWIGTYEDNEAQGKGNYVIFETEDEEKSPARITDPHDGEWLDSAKAIEVEWEKTDYDAEYYLTVEDTVTGSFVVKNKYVEDTTYLIKAGTLTPEKRYKISLSTECGSKEVGTDAIYINMNGVAEEGYRDVPETHDNYEAIMYLTDKGVLKGDGTGYFRPEDSITRAEFVKIICEAFALKNKGGAKNFRDTNNHWAKDYISIASSHQLISGVSNEDFAPNNNVTYAQISKILVGIKKFTGKVDMWGGWPSGYVAVAFYNEFFEGSNKETSQLKGDSYYADNATRADVSQMVYNVLLNSGKDKTPDKEVKVEITIDAGNAEYKVTGDFGNAYKNPTVQQIYNYTYNRIKDREIYIRTPEVLNAIMVMIWTENDGIHYESNGNVSVNEETNDYGLCQLHGSQYKDLNWHENANIGIDKYATAYYSCMTMEPYMDTVDKAVERGYSVEEARAKTAYGMYNGGNGKHARWLNTPDAGDNNFSKKWNERTWSRHLIADDTVSVQPVMVFDGETYTYSRGLKASYEIVTKEYLTGDYAVLKDSWKVINGYEYISYDNNPLYGRLEWYCPGVGSLYAVYDMRNKADDNVYQFDIYRFTQDGREFKLPEEYIGYNKLLSGKIFMTKHGNVPLIGIECLANIFACDIDYKNQIKRNSTLESNLQKVTDKLSATDMPEKEPEKPSFAEVLEKLANEQLKRTSGYYLRSPYYVETKNGSVTYPNIWDAKIDTQWCVLFATWVAGEALLRYGLSVEEAEALVPYHCGTGRLIAIYDKQGRYHSFTSWTNYAMNTEGELYSEEGGIKGYSVTANTKKLDYIPEPGDFIAVETDKKTDIPDHTGLVISVDKDNKTFVAIEGNTGNAYDENGNILGVDDGRIISGKHTGELASKFRKVRWVDYKYSDEKGKWVRAKDSSYYVHGFMNPDYPD